MTNSSSNRQPGKETALSREQRLAERVVNHMYQNDAFSQWLGIEIAEIAPGESVLRMKIRKEMINGFGVCHGGVTFSLADSALAFASNSHGRLSLALEANMTYPAKVLEGDLLTARAVEMSRTRHTATYQIMVTKSDDTRVGLFRGTVFRTDKLFFPDENGSENE